MAVDMDGWHTVSREAWDGGTYSLWRRGTHYRVGIIRSTHAVPKSVFRNVSTNVVISVI